MLQGIWCCLVRAEHSHVLDVVGVFLELLEVFRTPIIDGVAFQSFSGPGFSPASAMRRAQQAEKEAFAGTWDSPPPLVSLGGFQYPEAWWIHNLNVPRKASRV